MTAKNDCAVFMHDDMSCLSRNNFPHFTPVDVSHKIIIVHGRHDGTVARYQ